MTKGLVGAIGLGALAVLILTSCSSALTGFMGVRVTDHRVFAEIRMCDVQTASGIDMIPEGGQFFLLPHPSWDFENSNAPIIDLGSTDEFLHLVGEGVKRLDISADGGGVLTPRIDRSAIEALSADEFLIWSEASREPVEVTAADFDRMAADFCVQNDY